MASQNAERPETGPFVLRSLLEDIPLSAEGDRDDIEINCVEFLDSNLYIGTSASEILHFVQIPPDPADPTGQPSYILASRTPPEYATLTTSDRPGVQQILLLPKVNKACILCNWTVTFYSLPELSPIFGGTQVAKCNWVGGVDLNTPASGLQTSNTVTVLISLNKKLRVVRVGDEARGIRAIDFAGSTISVRRDSFACVADSRSYALLDVDRQLKIPLFPISSLDDTQHGSIGGQVEDISGGSGIQRSTSSAQQMSHSASSSVDRGHGRSTSLGTFMSGGSQRQGTDNRSRDRGGRETPDQLLRDPSPHPLVATQSKLGTSPTKTSSSIDKPLPVPPPAALPTDQVPAPPSVPSIHLRPHIVSPSPQEFLLVTGTGPNDPGVGMFVNLEGDVTRSTLEFDRYPNDLVSDGRGIGTDISQNNAEDEEEGYVLATMSRENGAGLEYGVEIQRWDLDPGEGDMNKFWLQAPHTSNQEAEDIKPRRLGIRSVMDPGDITFDTVVEKIRLKRFHPFPQKSMSASVLSLQSSDSRTAASVERVSREQALFESQETQAGDPMPEGWEETRNEEELQFARRLGRSKSRIALWSGDKIWWAVRNPMISRLEGSIELASAEMSERQAYQSFEKRKVIEMINSLRGREAKTETEYMSLNYIRQLGGLLLFMGLISAPSVPILDSRVAEDALLEGGLDPRVILAVFSPLRDEVIDGRSGIWIFGGVKDAAETFDLESEVAVGSKTVKQNVPDHVLQFLRRYLAAWRRKKGFGSIADENEVFRSVDASLLVVLLQLDKQSPKGPARDGALRSELHDLVDHGMDCFDRAVSIIESYHRLFVLSRLYQSRKMAKEVLATWRRIVEGDLDEGGEFVEGEQRVAEYLMKVSNPSIVQEYGVWLAARNPRLGVQVFAEDRSKVKFEPTQVVEILRQGAPDAVKDYLEHLVFGKNHTEYVNELIAYYLDIVIRKLETSDEARAMLAQSYESYRALHPPKPTYRQFITDNAIQEEWWHSRLRLLQLLGGSQGSASDYDVEKILARIKPFTQDLVPEVIILDGRQSRHQEALNLLTHGLGDYDTAINYCLLGGSSIYHPISGTRKQESLPSRDEQAKLFGFLLAEFLEIEDISDRVEQTGSLLERFGGWFDVGYVLSLIPDTWSVDLVSGFLVSALRQIVRERSETMIAKALSGAENLKVSDDLIGKISEMGPSIEAA